MPLCLWTCRHFCFPFAYVSASSASVLSSYIVWFLFYIYFLHTAFTFSFLHIFLLVLILIVCSSVIYLFVMLQLLYWRLLPYLSSSFSVCISVCLCIAKFFQGAYFPVITVFIYYLALNPFSSFLICIFSFLPPWFACQSLVCFFMVYLAFHFSSDLLVLLFPLLFFPSHDDWYTTRGKGRI